MEQLSENSFKDAVRTYIELHDELMKSQKVLRDLRRKKEDIGKSIIEFMRRNHIDEFQVADGKLQRRNSKRTGTLKKEHILDGLREALGNDDGRIGEAIKRMNSNRTITEVEALRRTRQGKTTAAE
jgi:hypothetical protein